MDKRLVRREGPETSTDALRRHETSGARGSHSEAVLRAVRLFQGRTSCELMNATGLKQYQVRRRLTDLKNEKLLERKLPRRCGVCDSIESTWWIWKPTDVQGELDLRPEAQG